MISLRPYVNPQSSYLYGLYESALRAETSSDGGTDTAAKNSSTVDLKMDIEKTLLHFYQTDSKYTSGDLLKYEEVKKLKEEKESLVLKRSRIVQQIDMNARLLGHLSSQNKTNNSQDENNEQSIARSIEMMQTFSQDLVETDTRLDHINKQLESHFARVVKASSVQNLVLKSAQSLTRDSETTYNNTTLGDLLTGKDIGVNGNTDTSFDFVGSSHLDELVSHVASVAAQKDIHLPPPSFYDGSTAEGKVSWVKMCIDSVLAASGTSLNTPVSSSTPIVSRNNNNGLGLNDDSIATKETSNLKTALKDLQFAHQYLTKQYEEERAVNTTTMNSLRLKLQNSQELLIKTNQELSKQTQMLINSEMKLNKLEMEKLDKNNEINELNKKLQFLQIDHLGQGQSPNLSNNNTAAASTTAEDHFQTPLSPITGVGFPTTTSPSTGSTPEPQSQGQGHGISNSILRLEFKKMLNDITTKHEQELTVERNERKKLENLIKLMNNEQ